jgi:AcrR family transcriptional regulator
VATVDDIPADGRNARSQRTRTTISDALLQLLEEGHHEPRVHQVAKRANVSVRSVFHHFEDMEGLYAEVVDLQALRIMPLLAVVSARRSTQSRAQQIIKMHDDLYSLLAPLHNGIRFSVPARGSQKIGETLQRLRHATSSQIQQSFVSEISHYSNPYDAISRLEAVISFEMWDHFRRIQGCSRHATRTHMLALLMSELVGGRQPV